MGNLTGFGSYSKDAATEAKREAESEGSEFIKPKTGTNIFRVLPPREGLRSPFRKVFSHYIETGKGRDKKRLQIVCPRMTKVRDPETNKLVKSGAYCEICEKCKDLKATGNPHDDQAAYDLSAKPRTFANVLNRKDPTCTVKVWGVPKGLASQLNDIREGDPDDDDDEGVDFTHPIDGFDIKFKKAGDGMNTEYGPIKLAKKPSPILSDEDGEPDFDAMNDLAKELYDLDAYAALPTDEAIKMFISGKSPKQLGKGDDDDDEDDDEDDSRARRSRRRERDTSDRRSRRRRRAKDEDDDDEVEGEVVDDDDDDLPDGV